MIRYLLALFALLLPASAFAQGAVTSADPRATEAGQTILRQGGSAADAAMAMMLALTVVEPQSSGIGGGGFLVHHSAGGRLQTIDGRETAPRAATPARFVGPDGQTLPYRQAVGGGRSVGVPGNLRLMALATRKWGRLPWARLFEPAIRLAQGGYVVTRPLAGAAANLQPAWGDFPATAALYAPGGKPVTEGATVRNPALAALLRRVAAEGADAFYTGANARALLAAVNGSVGSPRDMTAADLAGYRAKERAPVCGRYRAWRICGMGPPSSGATTVLGILGMLERFDLKALGPASAQSWHLIAEAMQLAYADREKYLGDADFVAVPVAGLIDPAYLRRRSGLISPLRALGAYPAGNPPGAPARTPAVQREVAGTTHFVAVDAKGNVASMTSTIEGPFGSQLVVGEGLGGYALNNELTDFTFAPERDGAPVANRVEGGKRPLSSMAPTIVYDAKGRPVFTVGAAGGKTIIMQVAKALIAHLDWGLPARAALGEGLVYFGRDGVILEEGTARAALKPELERLGHKVVIGKLGLKANAAERTPAGWRGAADPRSVGTALGE
ncbi:MAG TPA: gamma-glutamyltransferase [Sphingomonas sp.]|jgi:gamma-glutamyltranspeptidase/glutathione hydrolase|uniref:gamma-glutamyltransferase n=1 Tax=Sphingomonas sp. TaxID=28214 RepID=UPI002ED9C868